jgi:DNA segregation ATPase FtsK/SpoIIIE-like protein
VQTVDTPTGPTVRIPRIGALAYGPPVAFTVELPPGMIIDDLRELAHRIAPALGARTLRLASIGLTRVRVELLTTDPLAELVAPVRPVRSIHEPLILGHGEDGHPVTLDLASAAHAIVQGTTGGGKSVALYSLLAQLTRAPDIRITGADPTGLLLRPWAGRWSDVPSPVLGTGDPTRYVLMLDQLVRVMDQRVASIPPGRDSVEHTPALPVLLAVLEEYPGVLRVVDSTDAKLGKQLRALVGRLLAEGRKAGVRVLIVAQRADASVIGGFERGQASHRLSFRVDSADAVRMLHPDGTPDIVAGHATAPAGVALLTAPGLPLTRLRAPYLPYADYCAEVAAP